MREIEVLEDAVAATAALDPVRARLLAELAEPGSAASLAPRVGLSRQKVNYHLRALEERGLVHPAGERRHGGLTERLLQATARSYLVAPSALGAVAPHPERTGDRLSAAYLLALGSRLVQELGGLVRRAEKAGKRLPTLALDAELTFRSPTERAAFTRELTCAVSDIIARYHDPCAPEGRRFRLVVASHPLPAPPSSPPVSGDAP